MLKSTVNMAHLGARAFDEIGGEVVQTTAFVDCGRRVSDFEGTYARLVDTVGEHEKEKLFLSGEKRYTAKQENFSKIPGSPVAYWVSENLFNIFKNEKSICDISQVKIGMGTGKNEVFVREWWEVNDSEIDYSLKQYSDLNNTKKKYFPYNKGGDFRLWYGNLQEVLWFDSNGRSKMNQMSGHRENGGKDYYFKEGITWSFISSSRFGVRSRPSGSLFDVAGSTLFVNSDNNYWYVLGFLCSTVCNYILGALNPTLNYQAGNIKSLPICFEQKDTINDIAKSNVELSKKDWDSFETSWDFEQHPLV